MTYRFSLLGTLLAAAFIQSSAATAADLNLRPSDWSAFHVGIGGGYGSSNTELKANIGRWSADLNGIGGKGWLGTVEAGYDYQLNDSFVIGVAADYTAMRISSSFKLANHSDSLHASLDASHSASAIVRAGMLWDNNTLVYGLGGYTHAWWNTDATFDGNNISGGNLDFDRGGYTIGAGIETEVTDSVTVKLEYRYSKFSSVDLFDLAGVTAKHGNSAKAFPDMQVVRGVLSYRF